MNIIELFTDQTERFLCSRWLERAIWAVIGAAALHFLPPILSTFLNS